MSIIIPVEILQDQTIIHFHFPLNNLVATFYISTKSCQTNIVKVNKINVCNFEHSIHNKQLISEALSIPVTTIALTSSLSLASSKVSFKPRNTREREQGNKQINKCIIVCEMDYKKSI